VLAMGAPAHSLRIKREHLPTLAGQKWESLPMCIKGKRVY
jgi:hypothetical protein